MNEEEKKKVIQEIIGFYWVFQKEVVDMFPDDIAEVSTLLYKALHEIYFTKDITSSLLARRLSITVPNTSRCLQQLSGLDYIIKIKDEKDKRITHICLTEKGVELVEKYTKSMDELVSKKLGVFDLEELSKLSEAFSTIKELFQKIGKLNS